MTSVNSSCPCCGRPYDEEQPMVRVDVERNLLISPLGAVSISPMEADIAFAVLSARRPLRLKQLIPKIYGMGDTPEGEWRSISVTICRLRKRARRIGVIISSGVRAGYRFDYSKKAAETPPERSRARLPSQDVVQ